MVVVVVLMHQRVLVTGVQGALALSLFGTSHSTCHDLSTVIRCQIQKWTSHKQNICVSYQLIYP